MVSCHCFGRKGEGSIGLADANRAAAPLLRSCLTNRIVQAVGEFLFSEPDNPDGHVDHDLFRYSVRSRYLEIFVSPMRRNSLALTRTRRRALGALRLSIGRIALDEAASTNRKLERVSRLSSHRAAVRTSFFRRVVCTLRIRVIQLYRSNVIGPTYSCSEDGRVTMDRKSPVCPIFGSVCCQDALTADVRGESTSGGPLFDFLSSRSRVHQESNFVAIFSTGFEADG